MFHFDIINVFVDLLIHLNFLFICLAADFGPWSEYTHCSCDSLQTRTRVCEDEPCDGETVESIACECVPFNATGVTFYTSSIVLLVINEQRSCSLFTTRMNSQYIMLYVLDHDTI